ncbi:unnamed protein product [Chrysoparadoxa australica]
MLSEKRRIRLVGAPIAASSPLSQALTLIPPRPGHPNLTLACKYNQERNRESARECRRRKKEHLQALHGKLAQLEGENLQLRLQLKIGEEAEAAEAEEVANIKVKLDELVRQGKGEADIMATMDTLKNKHADFGRDRTSAAIFHLNELETLLVPTTTTAAVIYALSEYAKQIEVRALNLHERWVNVGLFNSSSKARKLGCLSLPPDLDPDLLLFVIQQKAEASGVPTNDSATTVAVGGPSGDVGASAGSSCSDGFKPESLWEEMVTAFGVTDEQKQQFRDKMHVVKELEADLSTTFDMAAKLRLLLCNRNQSLDEEMDEIQKILTPTQTAKFILWVSRNSACMHMLNQLWTAVHEDEGNLTSSGTISRGVHVLDQACNSQSTTAAAGTKA